MLSYQQVQDLENECFAQGTSPAQLMEEAALGIARYIFQAFPRPGTLVLYLGKGNNAGDAILVGHHLYKRGWKVFVCRAFPLTAFKPLPSKYWEICSPDFTDLDPAESAELAKIPGEMLLVDGLLGIGLKNPPDQDVAKLIQAMHELRQMTGAKILAVDVPSGLLEAEVSKVCVQADHTVTLGVPKKILFEDSSTRWVGRLAWIRFSKWEDFPAEERVLTSRELRPWLPKRTFDFHKGQAGRVGIIAGSKTYTGAAVLACLGALRGGAGLITLYVKEAFYSALVAKLPPEIMVKCVANYREVTQDRLDVLAIGPGLSSEAEEEVLSLLKEIQSPIVLDAEALNMISRSGLECLQKRETPTLLTPHPGEMERLSQRAGLEVTTRRELVNAWSAKFPRSVLLLKGSRTLIGGWGLGLSYNSTGTPGMATGGMGDVLTGLTASLVAQGCTTYQAACLGAWLSGRAAECAIEIGAASQESLSAVDVAEHLKYAFSGLKRLED